MTHDEAAVHPTCGAVALTEARELRLSPELWLDQVVALTQHPYWKRLERSTR